MQTDARVLLNLAAEKRQQLCCSQGSPAISRGKKISSANSQLNLSGSGRDVRVPLVYIQRATCPRASYGSRQVCFVSVSILVSRAGLRFANLASPSQPLSAFQFSLTPSPPLSSPPPPISFVLPVSIPLFTANTATLFRIGKKRMENRVGCPMKERWREMKFEEASI